MKISRAYSLIELSAVILIIGVLIGGIKAGSELLIKSRLKTARALTQSSYAALVDDMILWLDATAEGSMLNGATTPSRKVEDGNTIQTWDDVNPQVIPKFSLTQEDNASRPVYEDNGINGLPTLFFNSVANGSTGNAISTATYSPIFSTPTFTLFVVSRPIEDTNANGYIVRNQNNNNGFQVFRNDAANKFSITGFNGTSSVMTSDASTFNHSTAYVSTFTNDGVNQVVYRNGGAAQASGALVYAPNSSTATFIVGAYNATATATCFDGYISEIIMYSRLLRTEERKEIEKYLGKKYGIRVS